ncbi:alpha/beta fold hydrolase [Thermomonospora amylolytica]|uniref:alpha/beta fold hydrolase n=1 Tax=Thermomonospora amylolytica TaxID=1411117 RepID=UPI000E6D4105|nr:alpha/beta fold hydrolase [Thermomonospora amylolytica]
MSLPRHALFPALLALTSLLAPAPAAAATEPVHLEGILPDGATYVIDKPAGWNGTVLLYSHGYTPGPANPAQNAPGAQVRERLLGEGYALIGSSYARTGWTAEEAVPDQIGTLEVFEERFGEARRTIAWGHSFGGMITAALAERHPDRLDGAIPMCGLLAGGNGNWNFTLDTVFALRTLLAPDATTPLVRFGDQATAFSSMVRLQSAVDQAQATPQGKARIALAAALYGMPAWTDGTAPPADLASWQQSQYRALRTVLYPATAWRQEAETRAGGNMSWNTGVDYRRYFALTDNREQVQDLYRQAGLDLTADLRTLNAAPRISADRPATEYMRRNVAFSGRLRIPVLTMHTTGDGFVPPFHTSSYQEVVNEAGRHHLLRQTYVEGPGHCTFTPAETVAALRTLEHRITTGHWGTTTSPAEMNARAVRTGLGDGRFVTYRPGPFPRTFSATGPAPRNRPPHEREQHP